jgi:phosphoglycerate dehydrogenase-like enzyme
VTTDRPVRVRLFHGGSDIVTKQVAAAWAEADLQLDGDAVDSDVALIWDADEQELAGFVTGRHQLRWLHTKASGLPAAVTAALRDRDIVVTNGTGTHGLAVAEHVAAVLLAHYKRLPALFEAQRHSLWRPPATADEVRLKTVGVIGLGDLGRAVARVLTSLGAVVVGLRRGDGAVPEVSRTYRPDQLTEFLRQLDVLVIAVPLTPQTRGLIGVPELATLPTGAFVVNVGRGPVLCEDALVTAVESGHLAGAALDVFDDEPLPATSRLWSLPNTIITPHCADSTEQTVERCLALMLEQIHRFRTSRPLRNTVDLSRGY